MRPTFGSRLSEFLFEPANERTLALVEEVVHEALAMWEPRIDVDRIKIACFVIGAFMAAVGGLVVASRLRSADNAIPVSNLLLNSIAAAVIGGASLFGGRGRIMNALQGALVIGAVESGMGLLGWPSDRKFMVTGAILLLAVTIDTVTRRARQTSGR